MKINLWTMIHLSLCLLPCAVVRANPEGQGAPPLPEMTSNRPNPAHFITTFSERVTAPDVIYCVGYGAVKIIGVHPPDPTSPGYQKAIDATRKYALKKSVKLDVCPKRPKDEHSVIRAMVYFYERGRWHNLNTKLLRAGLASAMNDSPCHVNFLSWPRLVQEARAAKRGLFAMGIDLPDEFVAPAGGAMPEPPADSPKAEASRRL